MIKKIIFAAVTGGALLFVIFTLWYRYGLATGISCSGNVNFHRDTGIMRLSTKLYIAGENGTLSLNGFVANENGQRESINRTITFKSDHTGPRYSWVSTEISPSIDENISPERLNQWFPAFYRQQNNKVELFITRVNVNSIMLSGEFVPYYICTQRH
ncbi:hypothetical protein [Pantoea sp. C2G6]|uniref:hypothetical protein n=1 Tax=Pantoea sp. C2G6 TaxID=3243084 RepID=UPI003EDB4099